MPLVRRARGEAATIEQHGTVVAHQEQPRVGLPWWAWGIIIFAAIKLIGMLTSK